MHVRRPLVIYGVSFIAGIFLYSKAGIVGFTLSVIISLIALLLAFNRMKNYIVLTALAFGFYTVAGFLSFHTENRYYRELGDFYGQLVTIEGFIDSEIQSEKEGKSNFIVKTNKIILEGKSEILESRLIVNVSSEDSKVFRYRSKVSFQATLDRPKPATNPGGFNYQRYLASIGISGSIYLRDYSGLNYQGEQGGGWLHKLGFGIRNRILGIIEYCLDKNQAGLLAGMLIGYKDGLDENAFNAFSKAGLTHIMVASGMNVAFIILPFSFFFKKFRIKSSIANFIIILILILFVFVAGFSASVVRAVIMGIIILSGKLVMRETDIYTSISAAAIILLMINPFTVYDIGFQLSFAATLSLVLFYPILRKKTDKLRLPDIVSDTLAATISAQIGVVPITLYYFNSFSTISILSNLLVVPLVQMITILGFIMVFAGLVNIHAAIFVGYINNTFLSFVLFVTEVSSKIPFASLKLPTPSGLLVLLYYTIVIYLIKRDEIKKRVPVIKGKKVIVFILILLVGIQILKPRPLEITFVDVGEGDSTFIKTSHGITTLIDGGGRAANSKSTFDIGDSVMVPYILDKGIRKIDFIIATHGHSDHTEGLEAVLEQFNTGVVVMPDTDGTGFKNITEICARKGIKMIKCKLGDRIRLDRETVLDVMSPLPFYLDPLGKEDINESSLVLKLIYKNVSVLFTGDSGIPVEQRLLKQGLDIRADLIKIGHHGSYGSTSPEFIDRVQPKYGIISVGRNSFGHPSQFVLDRFQERGIKLLRTDERGAVTVTSYGTGIHIETMIENNESFFNMKAGG